EDEKLLANHKIGVETAALLDYLRWLTPGKGDEKEAEALFKQLGSSKFPEREKATADLTAMGPKVIPTLKRLLPGPTLEVRMRAERCIKVLEEKSSAMLSAAAARLLKARRSDAVPVLLEFAAYAPDEAVAEEVLDAVY